MGTVPSPGGQEPGWGTDGDWVFPGSGCCPWARAPIAPHGGAAAAMGELGLCPELGVLGAVVLHWWDWELRLALVALGAVVLHWWDWEL